MERTRKVLTSQQIGHDGHGHLGCVNMRLKHLVATDISVVVIRHDVMGWCHSSALTQINTGLT
jgi:hypothetical protein